MSLAASLAISPASITRLGRIALIAVALTLPMSAEAAKGRKRALVGGLIAGMVGATVLYGASRPARAAEPVVVEEVPTYRRVRRYEPLCHMERRRVWLDSQTYTYRNVEVCE